MFSYPPLPQMCLACAKSHSTQLERFIDSPLEESIQNPFITLIITAQVPLISVFHLD